MVQSLWKSLAVSYKVKCIVSIQIIPFLGISPKEMKIYIHTETYESS